MARDRWDDKPELARTLVDSALESAGAAVEELRELAAGIHPAILSQRGLDAGVESLASRSTVPVEVDVQLGERLAPAIETAAYFVVAEALTNVAKYAGATYARVDGPPRSAAARWSRSATTGAAAPRSGPGAGCAGSRTASAPSAAQLEVESPPGGAAFPLDAARGSPLRARR